MTEQGSEKQRRSTLKYQKMMDRLFDVSHTVIEAVLSQLGDGVVVCDAKGVITLVNAAAEKILGIPEKDLMGKNVIDVHPPVFRSEVELVINQLSLSKPGTGVFWEQNITIPTRKIVRINLRPVFFRDGTFAGIAAVMQDITDIIELDKAKTDFISTVAHELRTPLTALKGSLGLALGGAVGEVAPRLREMLDIAQNNLDRLIRLVDDMLDLARIETGRLNLEMDIVSVQESVFRSIRQIKHYADEHKVKIVTRTIGNPPPIVGDGDRIEQVVTNLLTNAIKFSPPNSSVEVVVCQDDSNVRVTVSDHGPGIPPVEQRKVFEKFYQIKGRTTSKEKGSGLGLAISKGIIEQHGGQILVKSAVGKGSSFTFFLPLPEGEAC